MVKMQKQEWCAWKLAAYAFNQEVNSANESPNEWIQNKWKVNGDSFFSTIKELLYAS